ncbi:MAG: hypothetical protein IT426_11710 [Pirellulales bacterium]|nr:hypothetical protein [Pirellulales bacterium]
MPRFVILKHDHPRGPHYDFMLEIGESLRTWSLAEEPAIGVEQRAEQLPDHRLAYLDYEGPVSDGRGAVERWDRGTYRIIEETNAAMIAELQGEKIRGAAVLTREAHTPTGWNCRFLSEK